MLISSYNNTLNPISMPRLYKDTVSVARLQAKREAWARAYKFWCNVASLCACLK